MRRLQRFLFRIDGEGATAEGFARWVDLVIRRFCGYGALVPAARGRP